MSVDFLSPQWMQLFDHTLKESKRLGLGVDLANATGWPFGGPWVSDDDASKSIYFKTYSVTDGSKLKDNIEYKLPQSQHERRLLVFRKIKKAPEGSLVRDEDAE